MALLIKTDESIEVIEPKDAERGFTLAELYQHIGCELIQVVPTILDGKIMIIDEEGKCKDEPKLNLLATTVYNYGLEDPIVGNAVICLSSELR
jgi:hypothetical protein